MWSQSCVSRRSIAFLGDGTSRQVGTADSRKCWRPSGLAGDAASVQCPVLGLSARAAPLHVRCGLLAQLHPQAGGRGAATPGTQAGSGPGGREAPECCLTWTGESLQGIVGRSER